MSAIRQAEKALLQGVKNGLGYRFAGLSGDLARKSFGVLVPDAYGHIQYKCIYPYVLVNLAGTMGEEA